MHDRRLKDLVEEALSLIEQFKALEDEGRSQEAKENMDAAKNILLKRIPNEPHFSAFCRRVHNSYYEAYQGLLLACDKYDHEQQKNVLERRLETQKTVEQLIQRADAHQNRTSALQDQLVERFERLRRPTGPREDRQRGCPQAKGRFADGMLSGRDSVIDTDESDGEKPQAGCADAHKVRPSLVSNKIQMKIKELANGSPYGVEASSPPASPHLSRPKTLEEFKRQAANKPKPKDRSRPTALIQSLPNVQRVQSLAQISMNSAERQRGKDDDLQKPASVTNIANGFSVTAMSSLEQPNNVSSRKILSKFTSESRLNAGQALPSSRETPPPSLRFESTPNLCLSSDKSVPSTPQNRGLRSPKISGHCNQLSPKNALSTTVNWQNKYSLRPGTSSSTVSLPPVGTSTIAAHSLFNWLQQRPREVILIDVRGRNAYCNEHIDAPLSVCIEPSTLWQGMNLEQMSTMLLSYPNEYQALKLCRQATLVILFDQSTVRLQGGQPQYLRIVEQALHGYGITPHLLCGGIDSWKREGFLVVPSSGRPKSHSLSSPNTPPLIKMPEPPLQHLSSTVQPNYVEVIRTLKPKPVSAPVPSLSPPAPLHKRLEMPVPGRAPTNIFANSAASASANSLHLVGMDLRSNSKFGSSAPPQASLPGYLPTMHPPTYSSNSMPLQNTTAGSYNPALRHKQVRVGLRNLGNTCYMNCVIQCLVSVGRLVEPFADQTYRKYVNVDSRLGYKGQLAEEFAALVFEMFRDNAESVVPFKLKNLVGKLSDSFEGDEQQDCHEFLTFMLDGLHEDMNAAGSRPRPPALAEIEEQYRERLNVRVAAAIEWERYLQTDTSLIVDLFQGQYLSRLECLTCRQTSTTYTAFSTLSLPLVSGTQVNLLDCFQQFTAPEVLEGDNAWKCPKCMCKQRARKTMCISRLPPVLIIHFKRFRRTANSVNKLETPVNYPLHHLDLTQFWPAIPVTRKEDLDRLQCMPDRGQTPPFIYDLDAVTVHQGSLKSGHYTAYVRKPEGWFLFDDTTILPVSESEAMSRDAYLLLYRRV